MNEADKTASSIALAINSQVTVVKCWDEEVLVYESTELEDLF